MEAIITRSDQLSPPIRAKACYSAGILQVSEGSVEFARRAQPLMTESLELYRAVGDHQGTADALTELGHIEMYAGNNAQALVLLDESLTLFEDSQYIEGRVIDLVGLAAVAAASGQPERAARLCGAVELDLTAEAGFISIYRSGLPWSIYYAEYDRVTAAIRAQLDEAAFAAAWAVGRAMTIEQAVAYGLEEV